MALEGSYQPEWNNDVTTVPIVVRYVLPTDYCQYIHFPSCPRDVWSSRRMSLPKDMESGWDILKQAVLQALGGRYMNGYKHQEDKKTSTNALKTDTFKSRNISLL